MPITIEPYRQEHVHAVCEFNARLAAAGVTYQFPNSPVPRWLPPVGSVPLYQEYFLAVEDSAVRGAYILKPQLFSVGGEDLMLADYQLPLSEGIINPRYAILGLMLLKDALRRWPLMFGLGMGGHSEAIAKLFKIMRWEAVDCPFFFRVNRAARFLRNIVPLRRSATRRVVLDAAALSGLGAAGIGVLQRTKGRPRPSPGLTWEEAPLFSSWCDEVWRAAHGRYAAIARRDSTILNTLYPASQPRFIRLRIRRTDQDLGWAIVLDTQMKNNKFFGDMRVGSVVDCLAVPGSERDVVAAATCHLSDRGVDIIVSNQLQETWCEGFSASGFLSGPSNYIFASSPALAERLRPFVENARHVHMTRGDGDGPYML